MGARSEPFRWARGERPIAARRVVFARRSGWELPFPRSAYTEPSSFGLRWHRGATKMGTMRARKTRPQLREEAYERLGVAPEQAAAVIPLSRLFRRLEGGRSEAIGLLRGSEDPAARAFLAVYDDAPASSRALLPPEAFCRAANVTTYRLVGIVVEEFVRLGMLESAFILGMNLPEITHKTVEYAMKPGGWRERELLFKASGFLPYPGGYRGTIIDLLDKQQQAPTRLPPMEAVILSFNEPREKPALPVTHAKETR